MEGALETDSKMLETYHNERVARVLDDRRLSTTLMHYLNVVL